MLVVAKSKVAPLKPLSIPRMELEAAEMGSRLAKKIVNVRNLQVDSTTFWSNSRTFLQWLVIDPRHFQQFVMHRIGEILETTRADQWRWIPSKLNVADGATKVINNPQTDTWLYGPEFLKNEPNSWPTIPSKPTEVDTTELRTHIFTTRKAGKVQLDIEYFSDWRRLYRAVAVMFLYIHPLRAKCNRIDMPGVVTTVHVEEAQNLLCKEAQGLEFADGLNSLKGQKPISAKCRLTGLNVYLDDKEILRTKGRVNAIENSADAIILPPESRVTFLLVRFYHEKYHHLAHETVINDIKSKLYILRLRVLHKSVRKACQISKNRSAIPQPPQMAAVPKEVGVGVDYFGPILVNVGRRKEKRWDALLTCLTLRAVHFEIAHSLDTSSCVMCLTNFMALRGTPREIYSDNGTNFKATEKAVREELIKIDFDKIAINLDSEDDSALTPNHLLMGSSNGYKPINPEHLNLRRQWNEVKRFGDRFWQRWVKEFTPMLTRRTKWFEKCPAISVGSIVIIVDENLPRNLWLKGRVTNTIPAKDGQVRRATIKTQHGILDRPATKIAVLDVGEGEGISIQRVVPACNSKFAQESVTNRMGRSTGISNSNPPRIVEESRGNGCRES
nr:uncharacterized protein LOC121503205 [Drosophila kikkawai]